jgi:prefoldin subunit 5
MSIDPTSKVSASHTPAVFATSVRLMGPDDVLAYVARALGDVGSQIDDIRKQVDARQAKSAELREIVAELRNMQGGGGDLTHYDAEKYDAMMTKLSHFAEGNGPAAKVYESFLQSYGGYRDTEKGGAIVGTLAGDKANDSQDMLMNAAELTSAVKNIEEAQSALGSENEVTMMNLQQLMQRRNQVTQFSSNSLNSINEGLKSVIGNIR